MVRKAAVLVAAALVAQSAVADLPVHCLRHQIAGSWKLHLAAPTVERSTCGHQAPDMEDQQPNPAAMAVKRTVSLTLEDPSVAVMEGGGKGTWSMVYDEGFLLELPDLRMFAFSKFVLSPGAPAAHRTFRSMCGRTEVGWYREKKSGQWGCYWAEKAKSSERDTFTEYASLMSLTEDDRAQYSAKRSTIQQQQLVAAINQAADGWKAEAYPRFAGMSLEQLNAKAGRMRQLSVPSEPAPAPAPSSFLTRRRSVDNNTHSLLSDAPMPVEWDWRNVGGKSYVDPPMDQQDCGSCWAVAATKMFTARYRIMKKDPAAEGFSINFPLYCSEFNQGCKGGYPILSAIWGRDVGMVKESCAGDYTASGSLTCAQLVAQSKTSVDKCAAAPTMVRVAEYGYVGGYYGGCNEQKLQRELYERGPVAIALKPTPDFMYYRSGVFSATPVSRSLEWFRVDHAVLLVGWGVEKTASGEMPYWVVQNSWGQDWGDAGYIKVRRGRNEIGVEFMAEYGTLEEVPNTKSLSQFVSTITKEGHGLTPI